MHLRCAIQPNNFPLLRCFLYTFAFRFIQIKTVLKNYKVEECHQPTNKYKLFQMLHVFLLNLAKLNSLCSQLRFTVEFILTFYI